MKRRLLFVPLLVAVVVGVWWLAQRSTRANDATQSALSAADETQEIATTPEVLASVGREERDDSTTKPKSVIADLVEAAKDLVRSDEGTTLYGFVVASDGSPSPQAYLSATDRFGVVVRGRASDSGAYSIPALAAGPWWIGASSTTREKATTRIEIAAGEREKRLDLRLDVQPSVLVYVVDRDGVASKGRGLIAVATLEPPGPWFDEIQGSLNNPFGVGQFWQSGLRQEELPPDCLGQLLLSVTPPVFVSLVWYQHVIATQRVEVDQTEVRFVLDGKGLQGASLRARFVAAETRAPIDPLMVTLDATATKMGKTKDGVFEAKGLAPGNYVLRTRANGLENVERRLLIEPGIDVDLGDVAVEPEQWIAGTVVDDEGNGVAIPLRFDRCSELGEAFPFVGSIYTVASEDSGAFRIGNLARGVFKLSSMQANGDTRLVRHIVDTRNGPVENLRLELVRGVPLVVRGRDAEWRHVRYRILGEGASGNERKLYSESPQPIHLAPGAYEIEARGKDGATRRIPIVLDDAPVELELP